MRTEIRNGERVWTKDSIEKILDCTHNDRPLDYVHYTTICLLSDSLKEAGFTRTINQDHLNGWALETDNWSCYIKFMTLTDGTLVIIGLEKYEIGDLIYLWDKIRETWACR